MRKIFFSVLAVLSLALFAVSPVSAESNGNPVRRVELGADEVVTHDYFAAGDYVTVSGTVDGDAYLAGGNVMVDGEILGDLLVAGGNVTVRGDVAGDIRVAGGNIELAGPVGGNVTALGGNIRISSDSSIAGSLVLGAGDASVSAPIGKGIIGGAGSLYLADSVAGDVTYWSEQEIMLGPDASVSGTLTRHDTPQSPYDKEQFSRAASGLFGAVTLLTFIGTFLLAALFLKLAPNFMIQAISPMSSRPWASLFTGFAAVVLTPLAVIFLLVTVIGMPIAGLVFIMYLVLLMLGKVFAGLFVGTKLVGYFGKSVNAYLALLVGLVVYQLLWFVPFLGWLVMAVLYLSGVGSLVLYKKELYHNLLSKKLI